MTARPCPPGIAVLDQLSRTDLIGQILEFNKIATFQFSERWLRKQRTNRLRDLLRDTQDRFAEPEINAHE